MAPSPMMSYVFSESNAESGIVDVKVYGCRVQALPEVIRLADHLSREPDLGRKAGVNGQSRSQTARAFGPGRWGPVSGPLTRFFGQTRPKPESQKIENLDL